ncbi:MAG: hypothetical protein WKG06_08645 [Segetibacter sp.]
MKNIVQLFFVLFIGHYSCYAQITNIAGQLTDEETGKPVPGVSVSVKGSTTGDVNRR